MEELITRATVRECDFIIELWTPELFTTGK